MTYANITRVAIFPLLLVGMFFFHTGTAQAYYGNPYPAAYNNYYNAYSGYSPYNNFDSSYGSAYGYGNSYGYGQQYGGYGGYSAMDFSSPIMYDYGYPSSYYPTYGGYDGYGYGYSDYSLGCGCDFYSGY